MSAPQDLVCALAHLLEPQRPGAPWPHLAEGDFPALLALAQANKVPLLALDRSVPEAAAFYGSQVFQEALAAEGEAWALLRGEYALVQRALADAGIRAVVIKSAGIAPSLPYRSDNLDILVPLAQGLRARRILHDLHYVELKNVEEPHKFLWRKFHLGATVCAIHLHEFVGWGTGFMEDAGVLARARPAPDDPTLLIPSAEDALLITLAHAFYEDKAVKLGDLWKVMRLLRQPLDWELILRQAQERGWRDGLVTCLVLWSALERHLYGQHSFPPEVMAEAERDLPFYCRRYLARRLAAGDWGFPLALSFRFSKRHYYGKIWRDRALTPRQKALDALRHSLAGVKRRLPFQSQRPLLVTFSGMDGAGKTAQAEILQRACRECALRARVVWSRGGSSRWTDGLIRLVKPFLKKRAALDMVSDTRQAKVRRKRLWLARPWLRWGWRWSVTLDLLLQYGVKVAWPLLRGDIVLCDRYTYDALVELSVLSGRPQEARSWAAKLLLALAPRPRLAYLLDLDPATALRRKPEEEPDFLAEQAELYRRLAPRWGLRRISAEAELAQVADALTEEVLHTYYRGWRTVLNGLFLANPVAPAPADGDDVRCAC